VYPALVEANDNADGFIIRQLSHEEWQLIDAFEDNVYELHALRLLGLQGGVYSYVSRGASDVLETDWDARAFENGQLADYDYKRPQEVERMGSADAAGAFG
jgi:hypothetical protein